MARLKAEDRMREDHHDPRMRPSVDHLVSQLRRHKSLKDHPETVLHVIEDLTHRFYVFNDFQPEYIWKVAEQAMRKLEALMPSGKKGFTNMAEEYMDQQGGRGQYEVPEDTPTVGITPAGDSPDIETVGRVIRFDDEFLKSGIVGVIVRHRGHEYVQGKIKCRCTKFFSSPEEWANHVRIRIWRFFKNEFPPIPSTDEDRDVHPGTTGEGGNPDSNTDQPVQIPLQLEEPAEA